MSQYYPLESAFVKVMAHFCREVLHPCPQGGMLGLVLVDRQLLRASGQLRLLRTYLLKITFDGMFFTLIFDVGWLILSNLCSFVKPIEKVIFLEIYFCMVKYNKFPNLQGCLRTWCLQTHTLSHPENV